MKRLLSGIQPSGELHVGNYLGAIRNWVALQDEYEALYCVVDLHAMTVKYDPAAMSDRTHDMAATLLACGIDPEKSTLFVQSHLTEHSELAWILNCVTPMGELYRMTQFKDKSARNQQNINVGLFTYPVLQAADILLYQAAAVPVGEDQVQHVELTREIARKFNGRFGKVFTEPKALLTKTGRIRGLDGQAKMSKSLNNQIPLLADEEAIAKLLRPAFTDPARLRRTDPGNPEVCNIFPLHHGFSPDADVKRVDEECRKAEIGCVECKRLLGRNISDSLAPVRERYESMGRDHVRDVLSQGAERARKIASATIEKVREKAGLLGRKGAK
ncbi:MAG: tryptophan--tRNA ligase [Deltaproteobacteria bacterium]|nr:tryptophan--tRNA ligase [Deltaproteobacteria bacterium]